MLLHTIANGMSKILRIEFSAKMLYNVASMTRISMMTESEMEKVKWIFFFYNFIGIVHANWFKYV